MAYYYRFNEEKTHTLNNKYSWPSKVKNDHKKIELFRAIPADSIPILECTSDMLDNQLAHSSTLNFSSLAECEGLEELQIRNILLSNIEVTALCAVLSDLNVKVLELVNCDLYDEGATLLASHLIASNNTIEVLKLGGNQISNKGLLSIANALFSNMNSKVTEIGLDHNNISDKKQGGFFSPADSEMNAVQFAERLYLRSKKASEGGSHIYKVLMKGNEQISNYGAQQIQKFVEMNIKLHDFGLANKTILPDTLSSISNHCNAHQAFDEIAAIGDVEPPTE